VGFFVLTEARGFGTGADCLRGKAEGHVGELNYSKKSIDLKAPSKRVERGEMDRKIKGLEKSRKTTKLL